MPQIIKTRVSASKKYKTGQVYKKLAVRIEWLDVIENLVHDQVPIFGQTESDELKAQLDDLPS